MKKIIEIFFFLFVSFSLFAGHNNGLWEKLPRVKVAQQEKIYLQFDKPYYSAGDRIWFRAFVVDANAHKLDTTSCAVYVELTNSADSLIRRMKLPYYNGVIACSIDLDEAIPEGTYTVRAYTNWMRNVGDDFFCHQSFYIGNNITSKLTSTISYQFVDDRKVRAKIHFTQGNMPLVGKKVSYYTDLSGGNNKNTRTLTTNSQGTITVDYNPQKIELHKPTIKVLFQDETNRYERSFVLPERNDDFDVQFFAEGGELVGGTNNIVAFKAIQSNGISVEITGSVFDKDNRKAGDIRSAHLGMGKFTFKPDTAQTYYAVIKTAAGVEKRFTLPAVSKKAVALEAKFQKGTVVVGLKANADWDSLTLVGHSRGSLFYSSLVNKKSPYASFPLADLRPGIISFLLIDKNNKMLSERLVFARPQHTDSLTLQTDKAQYEARDLVNIDLALTDNGKPVEGSFAVAVTDASDIKIDSTAANIVSTLLLTSDLKGYIEKPGLYFDPNFKNGAASLDLLMLTQGWRRFNVANILQGKREQNPHFLEKGQTISGKITTGLLNKPEKGVAVTILAPKIKLFGLTETDDKGRFNFVGFTAPDSIQYTLQAKRKKGLKYAVEIQVDKDTFPPLTESIILPEQLNKDIDDYLEIANQKYVNENGTPIYNLEAVTVREKIADVPVEIFSNPQYLGSFERYSLSGAALHRYDNSPLSTLLKTLPGMGNWNENRTLQLSQIAAYAEEGKVNDDPGPHFAWEDNIYTYEEIQNVQVSSLESVHVLQSVKAFTTHDPLDDILIVLNFRQGFTPYTSPTPNNIVYFTPLGYARHTEFYQPKYEVDSIRQSQMPDLRTTIAWQPKLETDASGKAHISFYTADRSAPYNIVIEGISKNGKPYYQCIKRNFIKP